MDDDTADEVDGDGDVDDDDGNSNYDNDDDINNIIHNVAIHIIGAGTGKIYMRGRLEIIH